MFIRATNKGFTLIELLVSIAIITMLATVVTITASAAREKARDTQRVNDLEQLRIALRLYLEQHGEYPCEHEDRCDSAVQIDSANGRIGVGNHIDTLLQPYLTTVPKDPLEGQESFSYYYDGYQSCAGGDPDRLAVIFARHMETDAYKNYDQFDCTEWGGEGGAGNDRSYMVVLGQSQDDK